MALQWAYWFTYIEKWNFENLFLLRANRASMLVIENKKWLTEQGLFEL